MPRTFSIKMWNNTVFFKGDLLQVLSTRGVRSTRVGCRLISSFGMQQLRSGSRARSANEFRNWSVNRLISFTRRCPMVYIIHSDQTLSKIP